MQEFFCKTRIITGESEQVLSKLQIRKLFFVTDPYFAKNGTAQRIAGSANAQAFEIFDQVEPDPSVQLTARGAAMVKAFAPDAVVALGGGSAMDLAKAMVYFSGLKPMLVMIPTTSGSGSEVTDFAILTHGGVKHPLVDDGLCPHVAILDRNLLTQLPRSLVADTGFDVLSHAAEAFVATKAGAITDALAAAAFSLAFQELPKSYASHFPAREQMHQAANMAGMAFSSAGLGLCHAMAHALGGAFHIPHGRLNAILLPAVVDYNAQYVPEKYALLAHRAGMGAASQTLSVRNLKNGIVRLRRELELPQTLEQAGVSARQIRSQSKQIVQAVLRDSCCETNPAPVNENAVARLLQEVTGG